MKNFPCPVAKGSGSLAARDHQGHLRGRLLFALFLSFLRELLKAFRARHFLSELVEACVDEAGQLFVMFPFAFEGGGQVLHAVDAVQLFLAGAACRGAPEAAATA